MTYPARETPPGASSGKLPEAGKQPEDGDLFGWCLLPAIPSSVAFARAYVRMTIARHGLENVVDADAAELVISEMVANALQHAYHDKPSMADGVLVGCRSFGMGMIVWAADSCDEPPVLRPAAADAESGRGLHLIDALSADWCWAPQAHGKVVYAFVTDGSGPEDDAASCPYRVRAGSR